MQQASKYGSQAVRLSCAYVCGVAEGRDDGVGPLLFVLSAKNETRLLLSMNVLCSKWFGVLRQQI